MFGKNLPVTTAKLLGALLLSVGLLWLVITNVGPSGGTVYVHVIAFPAVVSVDGRERRVTSQLESPVVFEQLPAGQHVLQVRRGGEVLDEYPFTIANGEHQVLTIPRHRPDQP